MSQTLDEMLGAWEKSQAESASAALPPRFYEQRKRRTPRPRHSTGGITPEGEAVLARELGLDEKCADPPSLAHLDIHAWVPDGEPGSYHGRREPQQPLGNDADLWD